MGDLLSIGRSGLFASKKGLETTGHNISNANTEGYSRQRLEQTTNPPVLSGGNNMGTGVRITNVSRAHDDFVEKRLNTHIAQHDYFKERSTRLEQVEAIFNEIDSNGLNQLLGNFFNSFRELANQPENEAVRSVVRDNARLIINDFKRIRGTLDNMARQIDLTLEKNVQDINNISKHIASLNKEISKIELMGGESGDLRDQRDTAIRDLSKIVETTTYTDEKGNYVVSAKGAGTLVAGGIIQELAISSVPEEQSSNGMAGSFEIHFKDLPTQYLNPLFKNGSMSAIIEARNNDIKKMQQDIDNVAFDLAQAVNSIHKRGYVNRPIESDEAGNPASFDAKGPTTGIDFFKAPVDRKNAAAMIDISDLVKTDLTNLTTALSPNSPGDNRVAIAISKIQHEKMLGDGTRTLEEQYLQTVANVGMETGKAKLDTEQSEGVLAQSKSMKERLSGVSIDEETANMVRYQHAYDASAKVLKTADEMFKTVLNIKN